jgi:nucleotide-binding universal stress UspA family protein
MYRKILIPLDGSKLAESALTHVEELAKCSDETKVILVSITERIQGYRAFEEPAQPLGQRLVPEAYGKKQRQAQRYLDRIAKAMEAKGIKVDTEVLLGDPAEEIVIYAKHPGCDLIVMSSHGRSGISRWTHGSVADKVFKGSPVPVLMVRAASSEYPAFKNEKRD